ncbi:hypothetical protein HS088_TW17G00593 [Tripterygium wilfordii]|uniref:Uncharacterized protein n=1 Tax=Tripterygium wilfordii TaxID=458696 RepID=A0A7J7CG92_TRIWF|nr:uncharacterized protein LOC119982439 [Tripterygium wilfordii]XP_038681744.1 uncharacterized protein LOC119982439 [Tripterygium wilfordii]KAF5733057.1 hypothetical protein HS088_TW17G00593 [Tripterygium wilfordii]
MDGDKGENGCVDEKIDGDKGERGRVDEKSMSQSKAGAVDKFLDDNQGGGGGGGDCVADTKNTMSEAESEALKKCLEENKGDHGKCKSKVQAFLSSSSSSPRKPLSPIKLKRGSLVDA